MTDLHRRVTLAAAITMAAASALAGKPPPPPYFVKRKIWQHSLLASREALMRHLAETAKTQVERPAKKGPLVLGTWYAIEPFVAPKDAKVFDHVFPPEREAALMAAEFDAGDVKTALAKRHGKLAWKPRPDFRDGAVHKLGAGGDGATYLYRTITAAKRTAAQCFFGGDDGIRIWLNGKLVYSEPGPRGVSPNQDAATPARASWCRCLRRATTTSSSTPRPGSG